MSARRHGSRRTTLSGRTTARRKSEALHSRESSIRRHDRAVKVEAAPYRRLSFPEIVPRPQDRAFAKRAAQIPSTGKWKRMEDARHQERLKAMRELPETKLRSSTPTRAVSPRRSERSATVSPSVSVGYSPPPDDSPDPNLAVRKRTRPSGARSPSRQPLQTTYMRHLSRLETSTEPRAYVTLPEEPGREHELGTQAQVSARRKWTPPQGTTNSSIAGGVDPGPCLGGRKASQVPDP